jgi:heptosyltransferase II
MNLAVVLPGWIGDAVMATPALRALRSHFSNARITGVAKSYVAGVLAGGDWFDELILMQDVWSTARALRRRRIELAVLFPNSFRSALTVWLGGCKRRVGYARYWRSPLLTDALEIVRDSKGRPLPSPILDAYNKLAEHVGCPSPGWRMNLFTTPDDEAAAAQVWNAAGFTAGSEVICLNPGAAFGAAKYWPSAYFADVARKLAEQRGCGVLVLCGPAEREIAREIVTTACHPHVHALSNLTQPAAAQGPPLSLGLTKALIRRCDLLITTDSGPRHFAAAFERPVVTLFGPTHIAWTETYHARAIHLQKRLDCGPCQQRVCPLGHHRCMKELLPAEVLAAAQRLLRPCKRTVDAA